MRNLLFCFLFFLLSGNVALARDASDSTMLTHLPQQWSVPDSLSGDQVFKQVSPEIDTWWESFQDPLLTKLIHLAVRNNNSLEVASQRVLQAQAVMRSAAGDFFPSFEIDAGWTQTQTSDQITNIPRTFEKYFSTSMAMSWEIDVFGSIRKQYQVQQKAYEGSIENYLGVMVSLAAQVASAYLNLRTATDQIAILKANAQSQEQVIQLVDSRYKAGLATQLDMAQAKSIYASTQASIPSVQTALDGYRSALAVLLGMFPDQILPFFEQLPPLSTHMEPIAIGIPMNLLQRRPDIQSADLAVAQQAALLGVARKEWLPKIFIDASVGFAGTQLSQTFDNKGFVYEIAPVLKWSVFQGAKRLQATRQAKAALQEAVHQYNQVLLEAVQETDQAMRAYRNAIQEVVSRREVQYQGKQVLSLSIDLYRDGLSDFQNVLDAQRTLLGYESDLLQAKNSSMQQLVTLYRALGGGWPYAQP